MIDVPELLRSLGFRASHDAIAALLAHAMKSRLSPTESWEQLAALERRARDALNLARRTRTATLGPFFDHCDLTAALLAESDLDGLVAWRSRLEKVDWSGSNLAGAQILDCQMSFAASLGGNFDRARFDPGSTYSLNLSRSSAINAVFAKTYWASPLFIESTLDGARFVEAEMNDADFDGAHLAGADFHGATFRETSFRRVDARGANFSSATFDHCVFKKADLRRTRFDGARFEHRILFDDAVLEGASFVGVDTSAATLLPAGTVLNNVK